MREPYPSYINIINIKDLNFTKTGYHTITLKVEESSSWGVTQSIKDIKDPDNKKEYCEKSLPEGCNGFNGREWHYFEKFPSWKSYCCGDDENEYYTKSNIGDEEYVRCCEENNMCVGPDSNCIEEGIIIDYNGLNYNCSCNEVGCNWVEVEIE